MVTEDDVRRVALSLPATVEKPYNRRPSFRVASKLFIRIHELADTLFARCANLEERDELLEAEPEKFFITPHYERLPSGPRPARTGRLRRGGRARDGGLADLRPEAAARRIRHGAPTCTMRGGASGLAASPAPNPSLANRGN